MALERKRDGERDGLSMRCRSAGRAGGGRTVPWPPTCPLWRVRRARHMLQTMVTRRAAAIRDLLDHGAFARARIPLRNGGTLPARVVRPGRARRPRSPVHARPARGRPGERHVLAAARRGHRAVARGRARPGIREHPAGAGTRVTAAHRPRCRPGAARPYGATSAQHGATRT